MIEVKITTEKNRFGHLYTTFKVVTTGEAEFPMYCDGMTFNDAPQIEGTYLTTEARGIVRMMKADGRFKVSGSCTPAKV